MDAGDRHANHHTPPPHRHGRRGRRPPRAEQLHRHVHALDLEAAGHRLPASSRRTTSGTPRCPACRSTRARPPTSPASGGRPGCKADFGSGEWDGGPIGIPYTVVGGGQPEVPVDFDYDDESDPGPYPIPPDAPIEGGPDSDGDRHVLVVDRDACRLYEIYDSHPNGDGSLGRPARARSSTCARTALRPAGWTSADAAGLPILAGLVRYDEVAAGQDRPRHPGHRARVAGGLRLAGPPPGRVRAPTRTCRRWACACG